MDMNYGGTTWELRNSVDSVESCALLAAEYEDVQYWTYETENKGGVALTRASKILALPGLA